MLRENNGEALVRMVKDGLPDWRWDSHERTEEKGISGKDNIPGIPVVVSAGTLAFIHHPFFGNPGRHPYSEVWFSFCLRGTKGLKCELEVPGQEKDLSSVSHC